MKSSKIKKPSGRQPLMKQVVFSMAVSLALAASAAGQDLPCREITLSHLKKQVPIPVADIISAREINGICEVILDIDGQYVPVFIGANFVIAGEMFQERKQVTRSRMNDLKARHATLLVSEMDLCAAMSISSETVYQTVYVITDPLCPYCQSAGNELMALAEKYHTEFKILLYSVHPPTGTRKAVEAVCRKFDAKQYFADQWQKDDQTHLYQCSHGEDLILRTEGVVQQLGVTGVPFFIFSDGQSVQGADIATLEKLLSAGLEKQVSREK